MNHRVSLSLSLGQQNTSKLSDNNNNNKNSLDSLLDSSACLLAFNFYLDSFVCFLLSLLLGPASSGSAFCRSLPLSQTKGQTLDSCPFNSVRFGFHLARNAMRSILFLSRYSHQQDSKSKRK